MARPWKYNFELYFPDSLCIIKSVEYSHGFIQLFAADWLTLMAL